MYWMVGVRGTPEGGTEASVASVFPDFPDRVFAHLTCRFFRAADQLRMA